MIYTKNQCPTCEPPHFFQIRKPCNCRAGFCLFSGHVGFLPCFIWIWNSKTNNPGSWQQRRLRTYQIWLVKGPDSVNWLICKKRSLGFLFRETQRNSKNAKTKNRKKQPKTTAFPIPSQSHSQCSDTFCLIIFRFCLKVWPACDLYSSLQSISKPYLSRGSRVQSNLSTTKHDKSNSCSCQHRNHPARIMVTYQLT